MKSKLEYIWLDGYTPTQSLRSKTMVRSDFGGTLEECPMWSFDGSSLIEIARASGLTNHRIGDEVITGGVRTCGGQDQMVVLSGDWKRIFVARFKGGELKLDAQGAFTPTALAATLKKC